MPPIAIGLRRRPWSTSKVRLALLHERVEFIRRHELISVRHTLRAFSVNVQHVMAAGQSDALVSRGHAGIIVHQTALTRVHTETF